MSHDSIASFQGFFLTFSVSAFHHVYCGQNQLVWHFLYYLRSNSCFWEWHLYSNFHSPDVCVFLYTRKRFHGCNNRESNVKSYENLGTNCGNSTLFQRKKPPNSCKARTVANVLRVRKHMRTTKFSENIKGSQNHNLSCY